MPSFYFLHMERKMCQMRKENNENQTEKWRKRRKKRTRGKLKRKLCKLLRLNGSVIFILPRLQKIRFICDMGGNLCVVLVAGGILLLPLLRRLSFSISTVVVVIIA